MNIIDGKETYDIANSSGGVQSTTMAHMIANGDMKRPDCFIFADTGWERACTYETIDSIEKLADSIGIPFYRVNNGNIRLQALESGNTKSDYGDWRDKDGYGFLKMPVYTVDQRGSKPRMSNKQCTTDFKIRPIRRFLREHYGKKARFNQWIGISLDEAIRMKTSDVKYVTLCYPLVQDHKMTRGHCIEYLKKHGIPIPNKSACIGCPLHSADYWSGLTESEKSDVIDFDERIRNLQAHVDAMPKPKKIPKDQLTLIDMNAVDEYITLHPLERRQDVQLFVDAAGIPLRDLASMSGEQIMEVQTELYNPEDLDCGGNCFI